MLVQGTDTNNVPGGSWPKDINTSLGGISHYGYLWLLMLIETKDVKSVLIAAEQRTSNLVQLEIQNIYIYMTPGSIDAQGH